jgi:hypothetical protein
LFGGKYTSTWPVTALMYHKDVTIYADIDACRLIQT